MNDLEGQVAIVTGAGQGVGAAIAERLAAAGAHLALVDRHENLVREVAGKIAEDHGHEARHYTCDVRDRAALADVVKDAATMTGRINVLVNNAGRWISGPFVDSAPLDWEEQIDINFGAVLTLTQLVLPKMVDGGYGRVVNIISDSARVGEPGVAVYAGAKAATAGFSRVLAKEVGTFGITVNCVSLSTTVTPGAFETFTEAQMVKMRRLYPTGRLGLPEDAAAAVGYFASPAASQTTGQTLSVNGGYATIS